MPKENKIKSTHCLASPLPPLIHAGADNIRISPKVKKTFLKKVKKNLKKVLKYAKRKTKWIASPLPPSLPGSRLPYHINYLPGRGYILHHFKEKKKEIQVVRKTPQDRLPTSACCPSFGRDTKRPLAICWVLPTSWQPTNQTRHL